MSIKYGGWKSPKPTNAIRQCMGYVLVVSITSIVVALVCSPHSEGQKANSAEESRGMVVFGVSFCAMLFSAGAFLFSKVSTDPIRPSFPRYTSEWITRDDASHSARREPDSPDFGTYEEMCDLAYDLRKTHASVELYQSGRCEWAVKAWKEKP